MAAAIANALVPGAPAHILNILANEASERFAFYGTRSALVLYATANTTDPVAPGLGYSRPEAISLVSYWISLCYIAPLIGGYLADSRWGRFNTILRFSLLYLVGLAILSGTAGLSPPSRIGAAAGLFVMALATGGIKPCVAPMGADQLGGLSPRAITSFFAIFYSCINVGSMISYVTVPPVRRSLGFAAGFAMPVAALLLSIVVFWAGRAKYTRKPPGGSVLTLAARVVRAACKARRRGRSDEASPLIESGTPTPTPAPAPPGRADAEDGGALSSGDGAMETRPGEGAAAAAAVSPSSSVASLGAARAAASAAAKASRGGWRRLPGSDDSAESGAAAPAAAPSTAAASVSALAAADPHGPTGTWLDAARGSPGVSNEDVVIVASVWRLLPIFAFIVLFWAIYDSYSSVWTLMAEDTDRCFGAAGCIAPEQLSVVGPILVIILIPLVDKLLLPAMFRYCPPWLHPTPLRRMTIGLGLAATAFVMSGLVQTAVDVNGKGSVHVSLMIPQYVVLTLAELFVSTTGLEFAYREAPASSKGLVLALFYLTTALGDALNGVLYSALGERLTQAQLIWLLSIMLGSTVPFFVVVAARYKHNPASGSEEPTAGSPTLPDDAESSASKRSDGGGGDVPTDGELSSYQGAASLGSGGGRPLVDVELASVSSEGRGRAVAHGGGAAAGAEPQAGLDSAHPV